MQVIRFAFEFIGCAAVMMVFGAFAERLKMKPAKRAIPARFRRF